MEKDNIKIKLITILAIFIMSFTIFFTISVYTVNTIKINGTMYNQIIQGEKLVSSILPPNGYIVETHLYVSKVKNTRAKYSQKDFYNSIDNYERLYKIAQTQRKYASENVLKEFAISDKFVYDYFKLAKEILGDKNNSLELINISDRDFEELDKLFEQHRNKILEIVNIQENRNLNNSIESDKRISKTILILIITGILVLITVIIMTIYLGSRIIFYNIETKKIMADKDKFYSVISHDLRGPVGNIAEILKNLDEFGKEEKKGILNSLQKLAEKTFNLLENLLEWTKIERTDKDTIGKNKISIERVLVDTIELFEETAKIKGITIKSELEDFIVAADERMLKAIFRNLISNAIKFTPKGGLINISAVREKGKGIIKFSDSGVGISQDRIDEFLQQNIIMSTKGTNGELGSGFGIKLIKEFIEANKGILKIESEENKGTEITIEFSI